jgi:hypothetical protein
MLTCYLLCEFGSLTLTFNKEDYNMTIPFPILRNLAPALLLTLALAAPAQAGGYIEGDPNSYVYADLHCYNMKTGTYCGKRLGQAIIAPDGSMNSFSDMKILLEGCVNFFTSDKCPKQFMRVYYEFSHNGRTYKDAYPE